MKRLILVGSPRTQGRSAQLAEELFENTIAECPEDELFLVPISEIEVGPCIGCGACEKVTDVILKDDAGREVTVQKHRCVFDDDMQTVYDIMDDVDEVIVVCPVYFSGAPGPFKCLLDRLQPYFWSRARKGKKRPATLHVIGEGGDPHGYAALQSEVKSALAVAGFRLQRVLDWVGKIDADGTIVAEAEEHVIEYPKSEVAGRPDEGAAGAVGASVSGAGAAGAAAANAAGKPKAAVANAAGKPDAAAAPINAKSKKSRPKLDLSKNKKGGQRG